MLYHVLKYRTEPHSFVQLNMLITATTQRNAQLSAFGTLTNVRGNQDTENTGQYPQTILPLSPETSALLFPQLGLVGLQKLQYLHLGKAQCIQMMAAGQPGCCGVSLFCSILTSDTPASLFIQAPPTHYQRSLALAH